jgi:hypothetical protein
MSCHPRQVGAQISGSNLLLLQAGNLPFVAPFNRTALYDQTNLSMGLTDVRVGLRFEADRNSTGDPEYARITQRYAEWSASAEKLRVRVGTFTAILGRGLAVRSFEVPGVVLEDAGLRSHHAFSRDTDGALIEGEFGPFTVKALGGSPWDASAPRDLAMENTGSVLGGEVAVRPYAGLRTGYAYARLSGGPQTVEVSSAFIDLDPIRAVGGTSGIWNLYTEYAGANLRFNEWWNFSTSRRVPHAFYSAVSALLGPVALSFEAKSYRGFRLGVNDPPSLVRQQTYVLLNRQTHVLDANDEVGYQAEVTYTLPAWGALVGNWSRGDSHVSAGAGKERGVRFDERFAELALRPEQWADVTGTIFYDAIREDLLLERHHTGGSTATIEFGPWSLTTEFESGIGQRGSLFTSEHLRFSDLYASIALARAGIATVAFAGERSTDPNFTDHTDTPEVETASRVVLNGVGSITLAQGEELRLFAGERRGGLACTAGSCYLVPPFRGFEITLLSRF